MYVYDYSDDGVQGKLVSNVVLNWSLNCEVFGYAWSAGA